MAYECIKIRTEGDNIGVITLNRPEALNALNDQLMDELGEALLAFDRDDAISCIILTGSEKAFAAGADVTEMDGKGVPDDLHRLKAIAGQIEGHTICAFGEAAAWPQQGFLKHFWDEFEYYVEHGHPVPGAIDRRLNA